MTQYMLMFSLGPVQTFIAQARKTRDLWIGSLLLSKLMEVAMDGIKGEFIFPATRKVEDTPDIPNKYIAIFADLSQAQTAAAQVYWDDVQEGQEIPSLKKNVTTQQLVQWAAASGDFYRRGHRAHRPRHAGSDPGERAAVAAR